MKRVYFKKIFSIVIISILLFTSMPVLSAYAGSGSTKDFIQECITSPLVSLAGSLAGSLLSKIFGEVPTSDFGTHLERCANSLAETALRSFRSILKKRLLDQIVDQTVDWIQNPNAKPRFITDFGGMFNDAVQAGVGDTIREIGLGKFCDASVQTRLLITLRQPQRFSREGVSCTLDQVVGNVKAFKNNFKNGSWVGLQTAAEPRNNPIGIQLIAMDKLIANTESAQNNTQAKITSGGGYLPQTNCNSWVLVDPNTLLSVKDGSGQEIRLFEEHPKDSPPPAPANAPAGSYYYCDSIGGEVVVTPAQNIKDISSKTLTTDIDYILNADDLEAYLGAIADAAINRLTSEATSGLSRLFRGGESPERSGGRYNGINDPRINDATNKYKNLNDPNLVNNQALAAFLTQAISNLSNASTTLLAIKDKNDSILDLITNTQNGLAQCMTNKPTFVPNPPNLNPATYLMDAQTRKTTTIPALEKQVQDILQSASSFQTMSIDMGNASAINQFIAQAQEIVSSVTALQTQVDTEYTTIVTNTKSCSGENPLNGNGQSNKPKNGNE